MVRIEKVIQNLYPILIFCIICLCPNSAFSSLMYMNGVATAKGIVPIQSLKVGDKVLSYNFNATTPEKAIIEVAITKMKVHYADAWYSIYLKGRRFFQASPQQMVFTARQEFDENGDIHFIIELVQAQYLKIGQMVIDSNLNLIPIIYVDSNTMYEEGRIYKKYVWGLIKVGRTVITKFYPIDMYSMSLEAPCIFMARAYKGTSPDMRIEACGEDDGQDSPLILMHNGLPALALGASFAFGSTPASMTFAEATLTTGGLTASIGPAGLAIGLTIGVGYFLHNFFSSNEEKLKLERSNHNGCPGGNNPKDPKNNKDEDPKYPSIKSNNKCNEGDSCECEKTTAPGSRLPNSKTDLTRQEFEKALQDDGWTKSFSDDGKATNYTKDGAKYSVRDFSKSTDGPTADYYKPGSGTISSKIRLSKG